MSNSNSTKRAPSQRLAKKRKMDENILDNNDEEREEKEGGKTDSNIKIALGFVSAYEPQEIKTLSCVHYFSHHEALKTRYSNASCCICVLISYAYSCLQLNGWLG